MSIDRKINRIQFLTGNSLKFIAVLTMVIDHLCKIVLQWLLSNYWGAMADNGQMSWERFREIDYSLSVFWARPPYSFSMKSKSSMSVCIIKPFFSVSIGVPLSQLFASKYIYGIFMLSKGA